MEKVMFQCNYIYKDNQACAAITNNLNDVEDAMIVLSNILSYLDDLGYDKKEISYIISNSYEFALKEKEKQADRFCPEAVN